MLKETKIKAWLCIDGPNGKGCSHLCRSKLKPLRCTHCGLVDNPVKPWQRVKGANTKALS